MNFEVLKFMLNKIIGYANTICDNYKNKPDTQGCVEWSKATNTDRVVFDELTEVLSCAFDFKPTFIINESKRLIKVTYENALYTREDNVTFDNFGIYMENLYLEDINK